MVDEENGNLASQGPTTRGFRDLRVWQAAMTLVESVYLVTQKFPRHEIYGLTSQMRRAAFSVPSNIAEGQARQHLREYLHHLSMAQGSLGELETQVDIAGRLGYALADQTEQALAQIASVSRQLRALRVALERRLPTSDPNPLTSTPVNTPRTQNPGPENPC